MKPQEQERTNSETALLPKLITGVATEREETKR
jgi:hypothetical protein